MRMENYIRAIAGTFVFVSALLGFFHSKWWLIFTMFVGLNLFQYGLTNWCLMEKVLARMGVK